VSDAQLFAVANTVPLLGWAALLLAPLRRGPLIAAARVVALVLAVGYVVLIAQRLGSAPGQLDLESFATLEGLARAFAQPAVMLVGWVHYLAFDLWVGAWEAEEAHRRGVPHWALVPCLVLTILAGPAGLVLFLLARAAFRRRVTLET
jgi:hypothetical protein